MRWAYGEFYGTYLMIFERNIFFFNLSQEKSFNCVSDAPILDLTFKKSIYFGIFKKRFAI